MRGVLAEFQACQNLSQEAKVSESGDDKNRKSMIAEAQYERAMRTPVKLKTPIALEEQQKPQEMDSGIYVGRIVSCLKCGEAWIAEEKQFGCDCHLKPEPKKRGPEFL
jgi:hypothetical protein